MGRRSSATKIASPRFGIACRALARLACDFFNLSCLPWRGDNMCRNFLPHARCDEAHAGRTTPDGQLFGIAREKTTARFLTALPNCEAKAKAKGKSRATPREIDHMNIPSPRKFLCGNSSFLVTSSLCARCDGGAGDKGRRGEIIAMVLQKTKACATSPHRYR